MAQLNTSGLTKILSFLLVSFWITLPQLTAGQTVPIKKVDYPGGAIDYWERLYP